jgi:hypothetical protein
MRTRHLGKAMVGLAAAAATIGLLGLPASAATGDVIDGDVVLISSSGTPLHTVDFSATGNDCVAIPNTLTMSGTATSGTWAATLASDSRITIGTTNFRAVLTTNVSGTYGASTLAGTGSATAVIHRTTGANCTYNTAFGDCTVSVTGINLLGNHTVTAPPTIQSGATATVSGDNGTPDDLGFEVDVTGSGTDCGSLITLIDGAVELVDVVLEAD